MKKLPVQIILGAIMASGMALSASAGQGPGVHASYESGVKVYRGAPLQFNHQAAAQYKALELQERQIKNQNLQAQRRLNSDNSIAQQRLDLDRRIAFTDNEIFTGRRSTNGRRFVTGGFNNRFGISNRFFGVNGISNNTRISTGRNARRR